MDQTSYNEFKITGAEFTFETSHNEESLTAQRRRSYLMEMNEDFDIQQVFKEINWSQKLTE